MKSAREGESLPDSVRALLAQYSTDALMVLVSLMNDTGQKPELRIKAAESVLDRATGREVASGGAAVVTFEGELEKWSR